MIDRTSHVGEFFTATLDISLSVLSLDGILNGRRNGVINRQHLLLKSDFPCPVSPQPSGRLSLSPCLRRRGFIAGVGTRRTTELYRGVDATGNVAPALNARRLTGRGCAALVVVTVRVIFLRLGIVERTVGGRERLPFVFVHILEVMALLVWWWWVRHRGG